MELFFSDFQVFHDFQSLWEPCNMYTELCLEWPNKTTDKLPREIHMKQLLVDSMLCFSFDRPVADNCPILVLKKNVQDRKNITSGFELYPPDFNQDAKWYKAY